MEPGSVASTFKIWPVLMSASAFLAFNIGSGQFRPRVSISFSEFMLRPVGLGGLEIPAIGG